MMKRILFFLSSLVLLIFMSACGDDGNNGGKPDVIDGSQAWSLVTFQRLSDGSFYYHDGQVLMMRFCKIMSSGMGGNLLKQMRSAMMVG